MLEGVTLLLGIREKLERLPQTLSGGQQQRVAIARALLTKPAILLADEPTGNLDSATSLEVVGLLKSCAEKFHQTVIVVTHQEEVAQMADRIIRMEDGRICSRTDGGGDVKKSGTTWRGKLWQETDLPRIITDR